MRVLCQDEASHAGLMRTPKQFHGRPDYAIHTLTGQRAFGTKTDDEIGRQNSRAIRLRHQFVKRRGSQVVVPAGKPVEKDGGVLNDLSSVRHVSLLSRSLYATKRPRGDASLHSQEEGSEPDYSHLLI